MEDTQTAQIESAAEVNAAEIAVGIPEVKEDPRALFIEFIRDIKAILPKNEIEKYLWLSKTGLFIKEDFLVQLQKTFGEWFFKKTQVKLDDEKIARKVFGESGSRECYLILGSSVVIGATAPCTTTDLRGAGIRLYEGIPLDTADTLHHTDPIFTESDALRVSLTRQGYLIAIKTPLQEFQFDFDQATLLRTYFRNSGDLKKYIDARTLRRFVKSFAASLQRVKLVPPQQMMIMPEPCGRRDFRGKLFSIGSSILVEYEGRLVDAFGIEGRGYEQLVRDELLALATALGRQRISGASLSVTKGSFVAHYDIMGIHHTFGVSAVFSFLRATDEYFKIFKKTPGKLKGRIIVRDIIPEITNLLRDAQPVLADKLPPRIREEVGRIGGDTCLCSHGEWYFVVDGRKMIRDVYFHERQEVKPIELKTK